MRNLIGAITVAMLATFTNAAPANDNFANATPITGTEGILTATTAGATMEENEPLALEVPDANYHSVWYKWTAPSGVNRVAFYTYAEQLAGCFLFSGMDLNNLTFVAGETTTDDCFWSLYRPQYIVPGGTYYICVASADGIENLQFGWKATKSNEFAPIVVDGLMIGTVGYGCPANFTIPNTVTWIACAAFDGGDDLGSAKELESVVIPESVAGIDGYAFQKCVNLSSVTFNKGMYVIKDFAFSRCSSLGGKTLNLPWMLKEVTGKAFAYIGGVVNVEAPRYVESQLFSGFYNETTLNVKYFDYTVNDLVNVILHPEGGEFSKGLSLAGRIRDDESTIVEEWKNQADWNNAISRKPRKEGYVFDGFWTAPSGGKQIWDADMKYVSGTGYWSDDGKWTGSELFGMDAYAHWKEASSTYTVRYRKYDGSGETAEEDFACGKTYTLAWLGSELGWSRSGYEFVGWVPWNPDTKPRLCKYVNGQPVKDLAAVGETIDLWAGWKSSSSYRVCFHRCAGPDDTEKMNQVILRNKEDSLAWMDSMIGWKRDGYTFLGWDESDKATTVKYANGVKVTNLATDGGTKHLYAVWRANADHKYPYKVKFYKYDGSGATREQSFNAGTVQSLLWMDSQLGWSRDGYEFVGWVPWNPDTKPRLCKYVNGQKVVDLASKSGEVVNLWAAWKSSSSSRVCFNRNDGTGIKMNQVILRNKEDNLAWMDSQIGWKREGYVFKGWAESGVRRGEVRERGEGEEPRDGRRHQAPLRHLACRGLRSWILG